MASHGRVSICGSIANYNDTEKAKCKQQLSSRSMWERASLLVPLINMDILGRELTIRGFMVYSFEKEFDTAFNYLVPLVQKVEGQRFSEARTMLMLVGWAEVQRDGLRRIRKDALGIHWSIQRRQYRKSHHQSQQLSLTIWLDLFILAMLIAFNSLLYLPIKHRFRWLEAIREEVDNDTSLVLSQYRRRSIDSKNCLFDFLLCASKNNISITYRRCHFETISSSTISIATHSLASVSNSSIRLEIVLGRLQSTSLYLHCAEQKGFSSFSRLFCSFLSLARSLSLGLFRRRAESERRHGEKTWLTYSLRIEWRGRKGEKEHDRPYFLLLHLLLLSIFFASVAVVSEHRRTASNIDETSTLSFPLECLDDRKRKKKKVFSDSD